MTGIIRFHETGGPDVLRWESIDLGEPGRGEVRLRHGAVGVNFIDVYERNGLYQKPLPSSLGKEAAGVVEAVGPGVRHFKVGDRVAYAQGAGSYSEARIISADDLVNLPDAIDDQTAAASTLKGLTAQMLLRQVHRVKKGDALLIHAAAGGVGSILVQWARHLGATVIAIVGSAAKADLVRELGAQHALLSDDDWVAQAKAITGGRGVAVAYDSVGKDTFMRSLDTIRARGLMVSYGNASGAPPAISPLELSKRGSLYLTRPTMFHFTSTRQALARAANEVFDLMARGVIKVQIGQTYPLKEAARAHADLEARRTTGSTVLLP
ncbi:quinone oxidoreductase family protein [Steroidobacter agaridevorans]|uniref:quinone oxidoreductase family protein n=1 Tax=Steroidobacter agaridevorans TaxID=2695856 RepID=UPI00132A1612|nr:quinone oxidoreductase [Steroidobacter agaridevorans]GFE89179.1 quinone oxidoreductase [Steroidobacter agaridevorans]